MLRWLRAAVGMAAMLLLASLWLMIPRGNSLFRTGARASFGALCWGFNLRVRAHGKPVAGPGTLYVANHISWTDIPVLAMVLDASFVAKREVRRWPAIGRFAWHFGCVFIDREKRGTTRVQAEAVEAHLRGDLGLAMFPEGTTGDGGPVLPFRSSLFALVSGEGDTRVQPVTMLYRRPDGGALSPQEARQIAWTGDDALWPNVVALAANGGAVVEIWFEEPLIGTDRKQMARLSRDAIVARLERVS